VRPALAKIYEDAVKANKVIVEGSALPPRKTKKQTEAPEKVVKLPDGRNMSRVYADPTKGFSFPFKCIFFSQQFTPAQSLGYSLMTFVWKPSESNPGKDFVPNPKRPIEGIKQSMNEYFPLQDPQVLTSRGRGRCQMLILMRNH